MARRVVWMGTDTESLAVGAQDGFILMNGQLDLPSFPDAQPDWTDAVNRQPWPERVRPGVVRSTDGRGFCLAPTTDWDALDVYIDDDRTPMRLAPGVLMRRPFQTLTVRPPAELFQLPTRTFSGQNLLDFSTRPRPALPAGISFVLDNAHTQVQVKATAGATVNFFVWNGSSWIAGPAYLQGVGDTGLISAISEARLGPTHYRPADISPDGVWNMADLLLFGACDGGNPATGIIRGKGYAACRDLAGAPVVVSALIGQGLRASQMDTAGAGLFDSNGNPGDVTNPSNAGYPAINPTGISRFYVARCGLEIWEQEDPPCDYRPRLDPERRIVFSGVQAWPVAVAGTPKWPVISFPGYNVDSCQLIGKAAGTDPLVAAFSQGTAFDYVDKAFPVLISPIDSAATGTPISPQALNVNASWIQLTIGGDGITGSVLQGGAEIIIRRRFIGG